MRKRQVGKLKALTTTSFTWFLLMAILTSVSFANGSPGLSKLIQKSLPSDPEVALWIKNGPSAIYKGKRLFKYINGGAEIYFEYGFKQALTQAYIHGDESLFVDIYEMKSPPAAFGIYSIQRDYKMPVIKIGDDGTGFEDRVAFYQDRYFVIVMNNRPDKTPKTVLLNFAQKLANRPAELPIECGCRIIRIHDTGTMIKTMIL